MSYHCPNSTQPQIAWLFTPRRAAALAILLGAYFALALPAYPALQSGVYQTMPGATVEERGDRVPNGTRIVPFSATLTFDFGATATPSLTVVTPNAVLEGGEPFGLTVSSSSGALLIDGSSRFQGDYLRDLYPSGTQYGFDWIFSPTNNGRLVWNGATGWYGGHLWQVGISNLTIVLQPHLMLSLLGTRKAAISWQTNFSDYTLEYATNLTGALWTSITNNPTIRGDQLSVTADIDAEQRFFRLHKP